MACNNNPSFREVDIEELDRKYEALIKKILILLHKN